MDLQLQDKVYLLAGASKGLAYSIAEALVAEGAKVAIASRDTEAIQAAATALGPNAKAFTCDMTDPDDIHLWVNEAFDVFGAIDGIVVNAGGPPPGMFGQVGDADWQNAFELTVMSAVRFVRQSLPALKRNGGSILMLTSSSVKEPIDMLLLSNVMRSSVNSLAKSLSRDLAADDVRVNCLVPGLVETDRIKQLTKVQADSSGRSIDDQKALMEAQIPMGRFGKPMEFGRAGAFLLSPAASYITGTNMVVDGGSMRSV